MGHSVRVGGGGGGGEEKHGAEMAEAAAQGSSQARLQQGQSAGSAGSGSGSSDPARPGLSQQQWASQKKAQVRAFPRSKKLEKLGVFSACKVAVASSSPSSLLS